MLSQSIFGFRPLFLGTLSFGLGSGSSPLARFASSRSFISALLGRPLFLPVPPGLAGAALLGVEVPEAEGLSEGPDLPPGPCLLMVSWSNILRKCK